jgi:hypothetical protein
MAAETDLATLLRTMRPELAPQTFVFATLPTGADLPATLAPLMIYREGEGTTLILDRDQADSAGIAASFPCRRITLDVHSSLEAVGFLAAITARLAAAGMGVNPVSAYHHDHLFVPAARAEEALAILEAMAKA